MSPKTHYREIRLILVLILLLNWAVAAAKIFYGIFSRCSSMTADGFHSLADGASNIVGLVGIHFACQPTDKDHPYGHKKYETLFSMVIAALLLIVAYNLIKEGIERLHHPINPTIDIRNFAVMFITLGINLWVTRYERATGKRLHSDILISDSLHTKADIFTSISVIATLVLIKLGFPLLDPVATLVISIFIIRAAYQIIKESSAVLCDTAILDDKKIADIVLSVEDVVTCHKIRTRGRPDDIHVDLHVQVRRDMHVDRAHNISYAIEETIKNKMPEVTDVVVHMEPLGD